MDPLPLKPFHDMTADDYAAIGFRCGLEVHQQLGTRKKLFCRCPAGHYSPDYDAEVLRHMRPTLSEMGEYDGTALMEKKTRKNIIYRLHQKTVCTYEMDDTPPFPTNDEAIDIAIEIALLCRLGLVHELHIARKQYLDGSIPTGFQRTTILGVGGWIPFPGHGEGEGDRRVGIRQLSLEEDSCREVSDRGHDRTYLTDRLGTPLIEVVTEPDMLTPQESAAVCERIGRMCRSTQRVRRGYGATRQDVNVSVEGGTRVEIKGVPQTWRIPRLVYNEASRQVALLRIRDGLRARRVTTDTFQARSADVTEIVRKTSYAPLRAALHLGRRARCVVLPGFAGLLNVVTQEYTTFAKEFADRIRVIACLTNLPNMAHSDAASESLIGQDWKKIRKRMRADARAALLLTWGDERDAHTACEEIENRAREATVGIPSDTRQPLKDGTTGFERVLPGADRMYPDTDLPPIEIAPERVERLRAGMPEPVWRTEARFRAAGMTESDVRVLAIAPFAPLVTRAIDEIGLPGGWLGGLLSQRWRAWRRGGLRLERLTSEAILEALRAHASGAVVADGVAWLIERVLEESSEDEIDAEEMRAAILDLDLRPRCEGEIEAVVTGVIGEVDRGRFTSAAALHRHLMGRAMRTLAGRVEGRCVSEILARRLEERDAATPPARTQA